MSLKESIKAVVPKHAWSELRRFKWEVWRARQNRRDAAQTLQKLGLSPSAPEVVGGPFKGTRYILEASGAVFLAKVLATYEKEIFDAVEWLVQYDPDVIINIGAAEGYFAVGMARRCPSARVIGFDTNHKARALMHQLVEANHVAGQVEVRGKCMTTDLETLCAAAKRPAVISDTDGYEKVHLDLQAVPALARAAILVELHDIECPGITQLTRERFQATHQITSYDSKPREISDWPLPVQIDPKEAVAMMDELRGGPQNWFLMAPIAASGETQKS